MQVLTNRSLAHLIRAKCNLPLPPASPSIDDALMDVTDEVGGAAALEETTPPQGGADEPASQPILALRCAERALLISSGETSVASALPAAALFVQSSDPGCLINLALAMLMTNCASSEQPLRPDAATAAKAARAALQKALTLSGGSEPELSGRALLALAGAHEILGDAKEAASSLRQLLAMLATPAEDGHAAPLAGVASGSSELASGDERFEAADYGGALSNFKLALRLAAA